MEISVGMSRLILVALASIDYVAHSSFNIYVFTRIPVLLLN